MNMATALGLFKENLLNVLPDDPLVCTLVSEQDRFWRQNPAKSILKFPTAVAFSSKHSILIITDKAKSTVCMANMHNPVCIIPIASPDVGISSPTGLAIRDNYVIVVNYGAQTSFKVVDIAPILKKSRALLQIESDNGDEIGDEEGSIRTARVKVYDIQLWSRAENLNIGKIISFTCEPNGDREQMTANTALFGWSCNKSI